MSQIEEGRLLGWRTSPECQSVVQNLTPSKFLEVTDLLLERPNLNSSHLFRADILSDSAGRLQSVFQKEGSHVPVDQERESSFIEEHEYLHMSTPSLLAPAILGMEVERTVVRRLIPRKPQLDCPLDQSCFIYNDYGQSEDGLTIVVVYAPHIASQAKMPWYHPQVKYIAYQYRHCADGSRLSVHYSCFSQGLPEPERLHRTCVALLRTFIRLAKMEVQPTAHEFAENVPVFMQSMMPAALKDTILPQHVVQDTYSRLKQKYAADLISRWVENTDPSKHVFEDLSIAAFLIELWRKMYHNQHFPGFVDIACGNGVLVYILIKEGYTGRGFDARKRKTWDMLAIDGNLDEKLYIPDPFLEVLNLQDITIALPDVSVHDGIFDQGTFIISNHADELTPWTPLLAALSQHGSPLPFLAIPCCSHALSGARNRYFNKDIDSGFRTDIQSSHGCAEEQSAAGDLKALRRQKMKEFSYQDDKSAYACLTRKTVALAEELGFPTQMTLLRIPSTRNIGVVGNCLTTANNTVSASERADRVSRIVERECAMSGGVMAAAKIWIERAQKLLVGTKTRGKINLGGKQDSIID